MNTLILITALFFLALEAIWDYTVIIYYKLEQLFWIVIHVISLWLLLAMLGFTLGFLTLAFENWWYSL